MTTFTIDPETLTTLHHKTILITGGTSGIGLATAHLLSQLSPTNNLALLDLHPPPATFTHPPYHLLYHRTNVTSWPSLRAGFAATFTKFARIDLVFANAGVAEFAHQFFADTLDSSGQLAAPDHRTLAICLDGVADTVKLGIHYLRKNGGEGGAVVLTSSLAGYLASAGAPLYSAAKHGVVGLMRALKQETAKLHISIAVVAPAITVTPILSTGYREAGSDPADYAAAMAEKGVPINKVESIALAACWLFHEGMAANGAGIFVQADRMVDFERGLAKSREVWMGREMLDLFRGGRGAPLFQRLEGEKSSL
ncbi:NAD(P)-binding protein [Lophium mytilinum]|uniref:NAD(P)-binding protein n=1 Tax=Lophium mytilinum TaxID=390894 RepID=A0A6A6QGH2_9PEZI|nr:NAD(P)-binding protein [Lophium mytilinum]